MWTFEGDIEEQALLLHEKSMKKEIPTVGRVNQHSDAEMVDEKAEDMKMTEEAIIRDDTNTLEEKPKEEESN